MSLPLRFGAEARHRLAGRVDANFGGVEHLDAEDVEIGGRTRADDFGEAGNADAHQFAARALFRLLLAQIGVANRVHRFLQRGLHSCRCRIPSRSANDRGTAPA